MNDDELLARLKAADPASTGAAAPSDLTRLLEATMNVDVTPRPATTRTVTSTPVGRRRMRLVAAAAAGMLAVGGVGWAVTQTGGDRTPTTHPAALTLTVQQNSTGVAAACAALDVDTLRRQTTAFEGTVTSASGDEVVLNVNHWYRGGTATTVRLANPTEQRVETAGQEFTTAHAYLIYATHGEVPACIIDAEATPQLRNLYQQAYGQ